MSAMDSVDYDLMKYEQKQDRANRLFDEFSNEALDILSNAKKDLCALKGEYDKYLKYDDMDDEINEQIEAILKF
jgi:hypothetical protein